MTGRLRTLIVDLLAEANIEVIQIEARTKAVDSFTEKISRKRAKYKNPLREITDLVGIRIIRKYTARYIRATGTTSPPRPKPGMAGSSGAGEPNGWPGRSARGVPAGRGTRCWGGR